MTTIGNKEEIMPQQTFPAGDAPRVHLSNCRGNLDIENWDERNIAVATRGPVEAMG